MKKEVWREKTWGEMTPEEREEAMRDVPLITAEDTAAYGIEKMAEGEDFQTFETHPDNMAAVMRCLADKMLAAWAIAQAQESAKNA
ncbi:MAG: hypothetical protein N2690_00420 [Rhodocyclaceae bacterium]|nr:hypothetical protein [Rhodocyclaceae bacterium]